jgi:hypothetical protein
MLELPALATVLTFGAFLTAIALVIYRLVWAASSFAGSGVLPRRLQSWQRWLPGEPPHKKPNGSYFSPKPSITDNLK